MRNKLIAIIASIFVLTTLSGCSDDNTILVNVENSEELSNVTFGNGNLILSKLQNVSDEYTIAEVALGLHHLIFDILYDIEQEIMA